MTTVATLFVNLAVFGFIAGFTVLSVCGVYYAVKLILEQ